MIVFLFCVNRPDDTIRIFVLRTWETERIFVIQARKLDFCIIKGQLRLKNNQFFTEIWPIQSLPT